MRTNKHTPENGRMPKTEKIFLIVFVPTRINKVHKICTKMQIELHPVGQKII